MTDLTQGLIGATATEETRAGLWFDLRARAGQPRRTVSINEGASPLGMGPLQACMAIIVAMLALPVLAVTLTGCGVAYVLRAFSGAGHG